VAVVGRLKKKKKEMDSTKRETIHKTVQTQYKNTMYKIQDKEYKKKLKAAV